MKGYEPMIVKVTSECNLFNCDKRHGNHCCYYCGEKCNNRCINDPSACGQYLQHKGYHSWLTKILPQGELEVTGTQKECLKKLSDYEATRLQPRQINDLIKDYRSLKAECERLKRGVQE